MIVHQVYAQIFEEEVKNVIVCEDYAMANYLARATYGDTAFSVDCLQWRCYIGCKYIDGKFYEPDGVTLVKYEPTQEQHVQELQHVTDNSVESNVDFDYRLSMIELGLN